VRLRSAVRSAAGDSGIPSRRGLRHFGPGRRDWRGAWKQAEAENTLVFVLIADICFSGIQSSRFNIL
jgi:hypothetical protein